MSILTQTIQEQPIIEQNVLAQLPVVFKPQDISEMTQESSCVSIRELSLLDIASLGEHLEKGLHQTVDEFAKRITKASQPKIFTLMKEANKVIESQKLDELTDRILNEKPGFFSKLFGRTEKSASDIFESIASSLDSKTKTIVSEIEKLQKELTTAANKQKEEIQVIEKLKQKYIEQFYIFAKGAGILLMLSDKSKQELNQMIQNNESEIEIEEMKTKCEALESRALAVTNTMLRLPAEQVVVTQLQKAGITTLVEVTTTASSRFANIKMTLISLNSALVTDALQKNVDSNAALESNLLATRQKLNQKIITNASSMAGNNRLKQAQDLKQVIQMTKDAKDWVIAGEESNKKNFEETRKLFGEIASDLSQMGTDIKV